MIVKVGVILKVGIFIKNLVVMTGSFLLVGQGIKTR